MKEAFWCLWVLLAISATSKAFECPNNLGIYRDYGSRAHYWVCVNFVPFHQRCPEPLSYDDRYKQCKLDVNYNLVRQYGSSTPWWWNIRPGSTSAPSWWGRSTLPPGWGRSTLPPNFGGRVSTAKPWYWHQDGPTSGYWSHEKPKVRQTTTRY